MREQGNWYLLYVGTGREGKTTRLLEALAPTFKVDETSTAKDYIYEVYSPQEELKMPDGKILSRNLFPGYLCVRLDNFDSIKALFRRVSNFQIKPGNSPIIPMTDEDLGVILKIRNKPSALKEELFTIDQQVKIVHGPLADFTGKITEINTTKQTLHIHVSLFGRETPVELSFAEVEKLDKK